MGNLKERITKTRQGAQTGLSPQCALRKTCALCQSNGYTLEATGAFISSSVCRCVLSCGACFGAAMMAVDGQSRSCRAPSPKRLSSLFNEAGVPARYIDAELGAFKNLTGNGRDSLQKILTWANGFTPDKGPGLIISGPVGVGKTYLLAATAKFFIRKGYATRFVDFHRLLSVIRSGYADRKSEEDVLAPLAHAEVLIIDELGKGRNNDWEQEKLDQIVMGRYNQNKFIIASTNYPLKSDQPVQNFFNARLDEPTPNRGTFSPDVFEPLENRIGKRIYSRLYETSMFVEMTGDDYRRVGKRSDLHPSSEARV